MAATAPANAGNYHALPVEVESVSNVTATNSVDLGTVRVVGGEEYIYVYNDSGLTMSVGYFAQVASGNSGYSVSVTGTTFFNQPLGVVKHTTFTTGTYGWLLSKGFTQVKMHANSSGIVGDVLVTREDGTAYGLQVVNTATTAFSQVTAEFGILPVGRIVQGATASAGISVAYVRCYGT